MKNIKKFGFSMSEVMIALTMIGIVATLTIANIGYSIQHKSRASEFKTTYGYLETALKSVMSETDKVYGCYICPSDGLPRKKYNPEDSFCSPVTTGCSSFKTDFLRALGVSQECESNPIEEGCVPKNYPASGISHCFNGDYKSGSAYVLDNSMILILEPTKNNFQTFAVDVNGKKGPNKWGQDIYTFSVTATSTYISEKHEKIFDRGGNVIGELVSMIPVASDIAILPSPPACAPGTSSEDDYRKNSTRSSEQMFEEIMNYN